MSDTPTEGTPTGTEGPSPEDVEKWTAAVRQIMADHPDWTEAEANAGLVWAVTDAAIREQIDQLAKDRENVALWTSVIRSLQARHEEWSEQECNDNLIALLAWVEAHPGEAYVDD